MKNVTFYHLRDNRQKDYLSTAEQLVCEIATKYWRNGKYIFIACEDKQQAIRLDEALWVRPVNSFVPHNLSGEGLKNGIPVEISWLQKHNNSVRDILISLCVKFIDLTTTFTEVVDFIPYEEPLKQLARERYKSYRQAGFNLNIVNWI